MLHPMCCPHMRYHTFINHIRACESASNPELVFISIHVCLMKQSGFGFSMADAPLRATPMVKAVWQSTHQGPSTSAFWDI